MRNQDSRARTQAGFTLIELMVVVALIAIIGAIALPSFRAMTQRSQLTAAANQVSAALQSARLEALKTNGRVELCPSTDGASCAGSSWTRFIIRSVKGGTATVLRDVMLPRGTYTVTGSSNVATNNTIWFLADGFVRVGNATPPPQAGTLGICNTGMSSGNSRDVSVNMGRISVAVAQRAGCTQPGN